MSKHKDKDLFERMKRRIDFQERLDTYETLINLNNSGDKKEEYIIIVIGESKVVKWRDK